MSSAPQNTLSLPQVLAWSASAQQAVANILARYPQNQSRSALLPLLHLAQKEFNGWLSVPAMQLVADTLQLPYIRVYEVASFYTMFNLKPVGTYHVQVCTNCSCLIRGSSAVVNAVKQYTGLSTSGQTTPNGQFTFTEVECLGACVSAPVMQVTTTQGSHYFTHLDAEKTTQVLADLAEKGHSDLVDTPNAPIDPITHATDQGTAK